jgi:hypothetical protein
MHHLVSDGWSIGVLMREICALYEALSKGRPSPLPELEIQYADYANWQRQYLTGAVLEKHLDYWKRQLDRDLPMLDLPVDRPRPSIPSFRGGARSFALPAELSQSLRALSRREGVTLFMILLAAFRTLLYKYTGQEEVILGTAVANRTRVEIEPLIGCFVNMLPLKIDLRGNPRFVELVRRVKEVTLGGYAHQDLPFERLVEELQPERAVSRMPLFNVAFGMQNAPDQELRLNGIEVRPLAAEPEWARLDLTLWITENLEGLRIVWTYSRDLFDEETIVRMQGHFESLLFNIIARPEARLTSLDLTVETGLRHQAAGGSDVKKLASVKRRGVNLSAK